MKKRHKIMLIVVGILLSIILLIGLSYAFYIFSVSQSSSNVVRTDCFEITYTDGNAINLMNTIPLTEEDAIELEPYTFTIHNVCNQAVSYNINLEILDSTTMNLGAVRYKIDENDSGILANSVSNDVFTNSRAIASKILANGFLRKNSSKEFALRLWIDSESSTEESMNKLLESKVVVDATLNTNYGEGTLIDGKLFRKSLIELTTNEEYNEWAGDYAISSIRFADNEPDDSVSKINVAIDGSDYPIFAWYDENSKTIYLYTKNSKIYLNEDSSSMFRGFVNLEELDISKFDSSRVISMERMFNGSINLKNLNFGDNFDTSNVRNMQRMFSNCKSLEVLDFGDKFDTSNVTDMSWMFETAVKLKSLDVSQFNTSKVTNMSKMFSSCFDIKELDISNFDVSNTTNMSCMFLVMSNLEEIYLPKNINSSTITNVDELFAYDTKLVKIYTKESFDLNSITSSDKTFKSCHSLVGGEGTLYDENHIDKEYARIDDPTNDKPGYFTLKTN